MTDKTFGQAAGMGHGIRPTGVAEAPVPYDPGMATIEESAMTQEIDAILARLHDGIPRLHQEMDDLLARMGRPVAA